VKNLREALELFLEQNRHCLRAAGERNPQTLSLPVQNKDISENPVTPGKEEPTPTKMDGGKTPTYTAKTIGKVPGSG